MYGLLTAEDDLDLFKGWLLQLRLNASLLHALPLTILAPTNQVGAVSAQQDVGPVSLACFTVWVNVTCESGQGSAWHCCCCCQHSLHPQWQQGRKRHCGAPPVLYTFCP